MGYTTNFCGSLKIEPTMTPEHSRYIQKFSETRRMKRDSAATVLRPDPTRDAAGLPVGMEGDFFVGEAGPFGQGDERGEHNDIVDYNSPPQGQPGLWCDWTVNDEGTELSWNQGEKFSHYIEWLEYLIDNFFRPWQYNLHGSIEWQGEEFDEEFDDAGAISVVDNRVEAIRKS